MKRLNHLYVIASLLCIVSCTEEPDRMAGPGPSQTQFCDTVRNYTSEYLKAMVAGANQAALTQIRFDRQHALAALMTGRKETNWKGSVLSINTDSDGDVLFTVQLTCGRNPSKGP